MHIVRLNSFEFPGGAERFLLSQCGKLGVKFADKTHLVNQIIFSLLIFPVKFAGRRLDYPVLKHLRTNSGPECIFMCVTEHDCCRSVNYGKKPHSGGEKNCQLLLGLASEKPDLLINDTNFHHYILLQPNRVSDA